MTSRQRALRVVEVAIIAFVVGVIDSMIKGQGAGLLGALSQTVVPWFLLAFLAGAATSSRRPWSGALGGLVATMLALIGFYFVNSLIFPWSGGLTNVLIAGRTYFELGLLSGPFFGAFGAWWKEHLSLMPAVAVGAAFVLEALARVMLTNRVFGYADQVAVIEALVGALWIALALYATAQLRQRHDLERLR